MPKTSIIIVAHNGLYQNTAPCIESIFSNGASSDFEVIVVDNNSSDETRHYLEAMMRREARLKCIFNESNRGFAGGNNDGLKIADGEILVLLNSDCIVTNTWIECLSAPLLQDSMVGMVGPVSNSTGNEQAIFTTGATPDQIIEEGLTWVSNSKCGRFETGLLTFFCVAMRRDVFDRVGTLDEDFGLGFYEDDDYCMRVLKAGYKLICAEDVFIYHKGGGSFSRLGKSTSKLMKENRRRLERKHRSVPPRLHPRQKQLRVIKGYLGQAADGDVLSAQLQYRISNRIRVIESQMPRGIFKRWAFKRRLFHLMKSLEQCGYGNLNRESGVK